MAISKFYFQLDNRQYSAKEGSDFLFETYYITEYVSRLIKKEKLSYKKANKILVYLGNNEPSVDYSEMFKSLHVKLDSEYLTPSSHLDSERLCWVLDKLRLAGKLLDDFIPGISNSIEESLQSFENDLFKNLWIFHSKVLKPLGKVQLECELNKDSFILYFIVINKEGELYREEILKELPDSLCYHHKFNKLKIENDNVIVPERSNYDPKVLFSISINDLVSKIGNGYT